VPRSLVAAALIAASLGLPSNAATPADQIIVGTSDALASAAVKSTAEEIAALEKPYVPHAAVGFV
jgi:hypothetical protein